MREVKFDYIFKNDDEETISVTFDVVQIEGANGGFINQLKNDLDHKDGNDENWHFVARRQFTGLKDKNSREIYEGDICKGGNLQCTGGFQIDNEYGAVVTFKDGMFKLGSVSLVSFNSRTEVIGNIYENPELVKTL